MQTFTLKGELEDYGLRVKLTAIWESAPQVDTVFCEIHQLNHHPFDAVQKLRDFADSIERIEAKRIAENVN